MPPPEIRIAPAKPALEQREVRLGGRQHDAEDGAAVAAVDGRDATAEPLDDARRDRQAEPGAGLLGREERLEQTRQDRARNAGAGVAYLDGAAERVGPGGDDDLAAAVAVTQLVLITNAQDELCDGDDDLAAAVAVTQLVLGVRDEVQQH